MSSQEKKILLKNTVFCLPAIYYSAAEHSKFRVRPLKIIGFKDLFKNYILLFRFMYSSFLTLSMETKKVKEMDCLFNKLGVGRMQLSHELPLLLSYFCEAHIKVCKTSFLAERNSTSTIVIRKAASFPVVSTLSNLNV